MPTLAYLERAYPAEYYAHQAVPGTGSVATKILRRLIFYAPKHTGDPKFRNPGRMVDIGCGAGEFLLKMRIRGWEVQGVEMSRAAAEAGRRLYGLDIVGGTLGEAQLPSATFDYVRLNHSFEHMTDPIQALTEIRRIIKPRGRLFIGVPNGDSLAAQVAGRYWWNLGPPVHPFTYNPATLSRLLREAGFAIERLSFNSSFAGLVGSLQIYLNRGTKRPSHVGWAMGCFPLRLAGHWTAKILDLFRMGDCIEITAIPAPRGNADDVARQ
jgi:SAM-dependent methyltransferase